MREDEMKGPRVIRLTAKERMLLTLLGQGETMKEAASHEDISYGTAKQYIKHAKIVTGLRTTTQMVAELSAGRL